MIWIVKSDFPRRGIPVISVFSAEGCDKGPRRGFGIRSRKTTDFRERKFKLDVIEGESFYEIDTVSVFKEEVDFSGASRKENEPKVIGIGPDKDVVDWFIVAVSFSRDVPEKEMLGARIDDIVQLILYEVVEFTFIKGVTELEKVVKVTADSRGVSMALYS